MLMQQLLFSGLVEAGKLVRWVVISYHIIITAKRQ